MNAYVKLVRQLVHKHRRRAACCNGDGPLGPFCCECCAQQEVREHNGTSDMMPLGCWLCNAQDWEAERDRHEREVEIEERDRLYRDEQAKIERADGLSDGAYEIWSDIPF